MRAPRARTTHRSEGPRPRRGAQATALQMAGTAVLFFAMFLTLPVFGHHKEGHAGGPPVASGESAEESSTTATTDPATAPPAAPSGGNNGKGGGGSSNGGGSAKSSSSSTSTTSSTSTSFSSTQTTTSSQGASHGAQSTCTNTHPRATVSGSVYNSTCDGRASENGNGSGGGRPCMGCVGNADYKTPKGQLPFTSPAGIDHNNGYECDGNNGIGKGNPAHTDCRVQVVPPAPPPGPIPQVTPAPGPPKVQPKAIQPAEAAQPQPGELAFTGSTPVPLLMAALGLALLGVTLIVLGRRQASRA